MSVERLSPLDSLFLHIEDEHQPMHVGALAVFEGEPFAGPDGRFRIDDVRAHVASRLHLVPRFRRRLQFVPFGQGRPVWVDDEAFDLAYHVRLTALPKPGDQRQLLDLMERIQGQPLDRRRPMWELWFVEGLEGGRVGLVQKTHHALIDGISGIDVATVLLDLEPKPAEQEEQPWRPEPAPSPMELLVDTLVERASEPAEIARTVRAAVRAPGQAVSGAARLVRTVAELGRPAPSSPFNVDITRARRFEVARVPFPVVHGIKARAGTTVNDVVLAVCAGAVRSFLAGRGEEPPAPALRTMVPVSVRADDEQLALGNRVSMLGADLPVGEADPVERLRLVHGNLSHLKESGQAVGAESIVGLAGFAPPTIVGLVGRLAVKARAVNLVVTNIPGPQFPLYCMGARMLEAFPYVSMLDGLALVIALISYDGQLLFGLSGDRNALHDLQELARAIEEAAEELDGAVTGPVSLP